MTNEFGPEIGFEDQEKFSSVKGVSLIEDNSIDTDQIIAVKTESQRG